MAPHPAACDLGMLDEKSLGTMERCPSAWECWTDGKSYGNFRQRADDNGNVRQVANHLLMPIR